MTINPVGPVSSALYVTHKCNHDCVYCVTKLHRSEKHKDMTIDLCKKLMRMFPSINMVGVGGGESMLCPDVWKIIRYLRMSGKSVVLSTNGTLVPKTELLKGVRTNISARASNQKDYERISGSYTFGDMLTGVENALFSEANVVMSFVITGENYHDIIDCAKLAKGSGVKEVSFMSVINNGFYDKVIKEEHMKVIDAQKPAVESLGLRINQWPTPAVRARRGSGCRMAMNHIAVDGDGNVALCCRGPGPRAAMGNISQGPSVWKSGAMAALRKRVFDKRNQPEKCKICKANGEL